MIYLVSLFRISIDVNYEEFIRVVQEDYNLTREYLIDAINKVVTTGRDRARENIRPISDTFALFKSIRTFSYKPPFGYLAIKGFSAGGYEINPNTGRLVNYAEIVDIGSTNPEHRQEPYPYFTNASHSAEFQIIREGRKALKKVIRRIPR